MTSAWANQYATSNRTQSLWQGRARLRRFLLLPAPTRVSAPYGWSVNTRIVASVMQGRYYVCALNLSYSGVIPGSNRELPELNRQFFVYEGINKYVRQINGLNNVLSSRHNLRHIRDIHSYRSASVLSCVAPPFGSPSSISFIDRS